MYHDSTILSIPKIDIDSKKGPWGHIFRCHMRKLKAQRSKLKAQKQISGRRWFKCNLNVENAKRRSKVKAESSKRKSKHG
jgi:hypothetical protein